MAAQLPAFVTFAEGSHAWRATGVRIGKQAKRSGMFSRVVVLSGNDLEKLIGRVQFDRGSRGYGYWRWKPAVIWEQLQKLPEDCPGLWYVDAGCTIFANETARARMGEYSQISKDFGWGLAFHLGSQYSDAKYTKGLVAQNFNLTAEMLASGQVQATAVYFSNNCDGHSLARAWYEASLREELFDDSDMRPAPECAVTDFVWHRHDQSVLSALVKSNSLRTLPDELNLERAELLSGGTVRFPIIATRHRSRFSSLSMNPAMRFIRMIEQALP